MDIVEQQRTVDTDDGPMLTFVAHPEGGVAPAVVVFMHPPGVTPDLLDFARGLAREGYHVVVPDGYHRLGDGVTFDPGSGGPEEFGRMMAAMSELTDAMVVGDTRALLQQLGEDESVSGPRACLGFGMGGRHVLVVMSELDGEFAAGVSLHPAFPPDARDPAALVPGPISGELYIALGENDKIAPVELVDPLQTRLAQIGVEYAVDVHPGADHAFMMPGPGYHEEAKQRSRERVLELFKRKLN